jgi:subtilisin family serine protease
MSSHYRSSRALLRLAVISVLLMSFTSLLHAQDATPNIDAPTDTVTPSLETPTATPETVEPTAIPPTDTPTDAPTAVPTDIPPTSEPTLETATPEATTPAETPTETPVQTETPEQTDVPTPESAPPVFNLPNGTIYQSAPGTSLNITGSVSDSLGIVRIVADTAGTAGAVTLSSTEPAETAAPFNTPFSAQYLAPAGFSGSDSFRLSAVNAAGQTIEVTMTVNVAAPVAPTPTPTPAPVVTPTDELIIRYDASASEAAIHRMLASIGAVEKGRIPQIGVMRILVPPGLARPEAAMSALRSNRTAALAGVTVAEKNHKLRLSGLVITDPKYGPGATQQWGLATGPGLSGPNLGFGIQAQTAWDMSTARGTGITVAVLDTGVDTKHPDLANQTVAGWDFTKDSATITDPAGHGTEVAGIIAARTNNAIGIAGTAFNAKIMPVTVCDAVVAQGGSGGCDLFYVAAGIVFAADKGAKIINLSMGDDTPSSTLQAAINYALTRNVVVVAAAGNNAQAGNAAMYPASYPGVISVGAHDSTGARANFSNNNNDPNLNHVTVTAPGVSILTTIPVALDTNDGTQDGYAIDPSTAAFPSGTSFSAAYVSGVAALLMSAKVATTPATVRDALICGAVDAGAVGYDPDYGYGRVNAALSMNWNGNSASCKVTQPNDNFESAKVITTVPFSASQPVSSQSVTEQTTDPATICGITPEETLWFSYKPTINGYYQLTTSGSSYKTVIEVYQGNQGALTSVGCTVDASATTPTAGGQLVVPLKAGVVYSIVVATNGTAVDDQVMQLRVNAAMPNNNVDYQENAANIAYSGMWVRSAQTGSSGGYTQWTSAPNAAATFSFRGLSFDYVRTIGPDRGGVKIYINDDPPQTVSNQAAVVLSNQVKNISVPGGSSGQWNTVRIVPDSGLPGIIDIDRIRTYDYDTNKLKLSITTKADDPDARITYVTPGDWSIAAVTGAYNGKVHRTTVNGTSLVFRMTGSALTIFRNTGTSGMADIQVLVDNSLTFNVSNTAASNAVRPYTIDNLVNTTHVVEIKVTSAGTFDLDAVQPFVQAPLALNSKIDDRAASLAYRGTWTDTPSVAGANALTTRTLDTGSEVSFTFSGNDFCFGYKQSGSAPTVAVKVDGAILATPTLTTGSGFSSWCLLANGGVSVPLADTMHSVVLSPTANTLILDWVMAKRYNTLTPARGLVQETDASFLYSQLSDWIVETSLSTSGAKPQGGTLKTTTADNTRVTFYINGTGFLLYTAIGTNCGCMDVYVDGSLFSPSPTLDLQDSYVIVRHPFAYGFSGLTAGIHKVELVAKPHCVALINPFAVSFDAIRVFP